MQGQTGGAGKMERGEVLRVGVVADTHVPDRAETLHPRLLDGLRAAQVDAIWHAGDVCIAAVLQELEQVAPVTAVRGNRDWLLRDRLPWTRQFDIGGVAVTLLHGQGNWLDYLFDKLATLRHGYRLERYQRAMRIATLSAKLVVFGHTHRAVNQWQDGRLWFNPGSAAMAVRGGAPGFGVLEFCGDGQVQGRIFPLEGARLMGRCWMNFDEISK